LVGRIEKKKKKKKRDGYNVGHRSCDMLDMVPPSDFQRA
jgi:hypothetical protein